MVSIGSFKSAVREVEPEPLTFEFDGETYNLGSVPPMLAFMRFAEAARGEETDTMSPAGMAAMYSLLRACMRDDTEFRRFEEATIRTDGDTLFNLAQSIYEGMFNRPTSPSSDSADGPSTSSKNSNKPSGRAASQKSVRNVPLPEENDEGPTSG